MTKVRTRSNSASSSVPVSKQVKIQFQDEGVNLGEKGTVDVVNFVGSAVSVARVGDTIVITITGGGVGSSTFIGLTDVPATYVGQSLKLTRVNALETALEFVAAGAGTGDVVGPAGAVADRIAAFDGATGKLIKDGGVTVAAVSPFNRLVTGTTNNRFHGGQLSGATTLTVQTTLANTLRGHPFIVHSPMTLDTIQVEVTTLVGGSSFRLGIYDSTAAGYPNALIIDSGVMSGAANGVISASISTTLQPGLYFLAVVADASISMRSIPVTAHNILIFGAIATMGATLRAGFWTVAFTFGALPNPFTAGATINNSGIDQIQILVRAT